MFNTNAFLTGLNTFSDNKVLICDLEGTTIPKEQKRIEDRYTIKDFPFYHNDAGDR